MTEAKLSRVRWSVGQVLLPEHFRALEVSLGAEAAARAAAMGLPSYGVARLEWNGDAPTAGALFITALTAVLPSGELIDLPNNARLTGPLDLKAAQKSEVSAYLHVLDPVPAEGEEESTSPPLPAEIPRVVYPLELSTSPSLPGSRGRLKLGEFKKPLGGGFQLSRDYIPPLVQVGTTPYLSARLDTLRGDLYGFEESLRDLAADAIARGESARPAQRARLEVMKIGALLEDMSRGVHLHPYLLFSALRSFLLELCLIEESAPLDPLVAYEHDDLGRVFGALLDAIAARLATPPLRAPHTPFVLEEGRHLATELPRELFDAREIYLIIQKASASDKVPLDGVRLACPSRLRVVHERALRGVRYLAVGQPSFRHAFGPAVDFYRLITGGDDNHEWSHVVAERALCFYDKPQLAGIKAALYWRRS